MITKEEAITAKLGDVLHAGKCSLEWKPPVERWRVNGRCLVWKRQPQKFSLPIKHGLYHYERLTELNASLFHWEKDCNI